MIKKFSKLLLVTIIALFVWTSSTKAINLKMDDIRNEVLEVNPNVSYIYIIGKHIFTDASVPLSLADFMLAARTIDVGENMGATKNDPIYDQMSTLLYNVEYNDDYTKIIGFKYGNLDLTGKGTPKEEYDIDYIDYNKLEHKNRVVINIDGEKELYRVVPGEKLLELETPKKEGYTFTGWYISGTDNKFNIDTDINQDYSIEARFEINKYSVVYKLDDDTVYSSIKVEHGNKAEEPNLVEKEDYEFLGWYLGDKKYDFNQPVKSDIELVGRYRALNKPDITTTIKDAIRSDLQEFVITVKANDYANKNVKQTLTFSDKNAVGKLEYYNGKEWVELTIDNSNTVSVPSEAFALKDTSSKLRITWENTGEYSVKIKLTDNTTNKVYSEVEKNVVIASKKFTVSYNNNGEVTKGEVVEGGKVNPPTPKTKTGYDFIGWYNGEEKFDLETPVTGNLTLVAKYELKTYTVTFVADDNTFTTVNVKHNGVVTKPATNPEKEGHTFAEWQVNGKAYDFNNNVTSDLTITAKFNINKYTVTFKNGDTVVTTKEVAHGSKVEKPTDPTKTGYTFNGWLNGTAAFNFDTAITSNLTLTAKFTINTYTVTFKNGDTVVETKSVQYNKTTTAPADPSKTGYNFNGWYNGDTKFETTTKITGNVTFTAKFTKKEYTITFDSNGGSTVSSVKVKYNESLSSLPSSTRAGYKLLGWYDGDTKVTTSTKFTSNKTLKAKWEVNNDPVTDVNQMKGTYVLESNTKYQLIVSFNNPKIYIKGINTKYNTTILEGGLTISGNHAYTSDGVSIYFYNGYLTLELSGKLLSQVPQLVGKYIKQ